MTLKKVIMPALPHPTLTTPGVPIVGVDFLPPPSLHGPNGFHQEEGPADRMGTLLYQGVERCTQFRPPEGMRRGMDGGRGSSRTHPPGWLSIWLPCTRLRGEALRDWIEGRVWGRALPRAARKVGRRG